MMKIMGSDSTLFMSMDTGMKDYGKLLCLCINMINDDDDDYGK